MGTWQLTNWGSKARAAMWVRVISLACGLWLGRCGWCVAEEREVYEAGPMQHDRHRAGYWPVEDGRTFSRKGVAARVIPEDVFSTGSEHARLGSDRWGRNVAGTGRDQGMSRFPLTHHLSPHRDAPHLTSPAGQGERPVRSYRDDLRWPHFDRGTRTRRDLAGQDAPWRPMGDVTPRAPWESSDSESRGSREGRYPQQQETARPDVQERLTRRYHDPAVLQFLSTLSAERGLDMYTEVLNLISQRHLEPPTWEALARQGIINLEEALQNPAFLEVTNLSAQASQLPLMQQQLQQIARQARVKSAQAAVQLAESTMLAAQNGLGLHPALVAMEFMYGAIEALDPFSAFVPPEVSRGAQRISSTGVTTGEIGIEFALSEIGVRVVQVVPNSPAANAGLQVGDVLLSVDGQSLRGANLDQAVAMITGAAESTVTLEISRAGLITTAVPVLRRKSAERSVSAIQLLDRQAGVGYLRLETFASNSAQELQHALRALEQQGMRSLVLDLRGDPGGLLITAIEVARLLLPRGTIVSTRGRTPSDNTQETATGGPAWTMPLFVLIDENSASASEILAAALQDNGRGVIIGRRSYGKGTVQTLFPLQSVTAGVRLTTARFYSPRGQAMSGRGVEPDVIVPAVAQVSYGRIPQDRDLMTALELARRPVQGSGFNRP